MTFKQLFRKLVQIGLPLLLGCLLLWFLYRDRDMGRMIEAVRHGVRYEVLLFSLVFGLGGNVARGFRWAGLIDSLGRPVRRPSAVLAVLGNYAINMALPRVGEIWRCGVVSKYENIPFTRLLGTMLVDRVTDALVVGSATALVFLFNVPFFSAYLAEHPQLADGFRSLTSSVWLYILLLLLAVVVWLFLNRWKHLPFVQKVRASILNIWEGVKSLWKIRNKARFTVQTLMIWGCYFAFFYTAFFAFDFTAQLGLRIALIAFIMSSIGVAVPVQGGIGVWHFMVISTLTSFGVTDTDAGAFAFVVYSVQTGWVVLVGLAAIVLLPIVNRNRHISTDSHS